MATAIVKPFTSDSLYEASSKAPNTGMGKWSPTKRHSHAFAFLMRTAHQGSTLKPALRLHQTPTSCRRSKSPYFPPLIYLTFRIALLFFCLPCHIFPSRRIIDSRPLPRFLFALPNRWRIPLYWWVLERDVAGVTIGTVSSPLVRKREGRHCCLKFLLTTDRLPFRSCRLLLDYSADTSE